MPLSREEIEAAHDEVMFADGFDAAILGVDVKGIVVYSVKLIIMVLQEDMEMDYQTAIEHFNFNIGSAYVGPLTPIYLDDLDDD